MLATRLCVFLKVLALAGSVSALLPEDFEDRAAPANLQEECASKCPDLDLNQVRILKFTIYIKLFMNIKTKNSLARHKSLNFKGTRFKTYKS